ncbi:hypothetical protein BC567DRAFT_230602 [Phyllosticta citribraziliensis]
MHRQGSRGPWTRDAQLSSRRRGWPAVAGQAAVNSGTGRSSRIHGAATPFDGQ